MISHLNTLWYLIVHKVFVFSIGLKIGVPIPSLVLHDLDKFLPDEWSGYVHKHDNGYHWLFHQNRNKHHWEYWITPDFNGGMNVFEIPYPDMLEMIADWHGAGKAKRGLNVIQFYRKKGKNMILHPKTRDEVESILMEIEP